MTRTPATTAPARECATCFFTTRFPGVELADDGRCNHCHDDGFRLRRREHVTGNLDGLRAIAAELRAQATGPYHCLVGASGGLDSSYVLYIARRLLGLNPLVVRYDSGLGTPQAARNLEALCRSLDVEIRLFRSAGGHDREYVRHFLAATRGSGVAWGVCRCCGYAISSVLFGTAVRENVRTVLGSHNSYEAELYLCRSFKVGILKRALGRQALRAAPRLAWHLPLAEYHLLRLKREFYLPPWTNLLRRSPRPPRLRHVTVSRYVPWDVETMVQTLERETGWRASHAALPMRFDCVLEDAHVNHTFREACGLTVHGIIANNLIRDGVRTKEDLAGTVRHYDATIPASMAEVEARLRGE